jgi:hypothetical protein
VSASNVLTIAPENSNPVSGLGWYDRHGKDLGYVGEPGTLAYTDLALSPEGTRVATNESLSEREYEPKIWLLTWLGVRACASHLMSPGFCADLVPRRDENLPLVPSALAELDLSKICERRRKNSLGCYNK